MCNLLTKFRAPELEELCNTYDILCFSESKLDQYDEVEIKSFKALPPLNRKNAKRKSGGIIVFVRDFLYENVEVLKSCNENVLWFIVNDNVFEYPVLIGSVYIPPESSTYSNIDIFDVIESDLIKYTSETNCKVCLVGDFNAHTGTKSDFTQINDYVCSSVELDNIVNIVSLETLGIDVTRYNSDLSVDNYGNRLLQMCQNLELLIANGRLGKDKGIGSLTCKNSTVVDYCILSPELFTHVSAFEVLPFDPMISDIHNALHIEILCKLVDTVDNDIVHEDSNVILKPVWVNNNNQTFIDSLNLENIENLIDKIDAIDVVNVNKDTINNLVEECNNIIINAASESGMLKEKKVYKDCTKNNKNCKSKKPWFNQECYEKRKDYHKAKCYNWRVKTADSRNNLNRCSKVYKKVINKQYNEYRKTFIHKLRNLNHNDPKSYWSLINRSTCCNTKQNVIDKVSLECFHDHFKKLSNVQDGQEGDFTDDIDKNVVTNLNTELNAHITEDEIIKAIKSLKNNKSCGTDLILNEFLKHSCNKMLPIFVKLFNIVFESGIIPELWSVGIMCPIYKNKGDVNNPDNYRGITILSCYGKLFTAVLNNRLNFYLESMNVLCEEQAGFRKNYGTYDHIFNLKCLIDLYLHRNKSLYCAFIDYRKAFDSINRIALWHKLLQNCIDGNMFNIIHAMYENAKSCVRKGSELSDYFQSNVGVRQGENLSPVLFSLFLNDLVQFISKAYNGLSDIYNATHFVLDTEEISVYLKLYLLLYADDTVILAETKYELQAALNAMYLYCKTWNLEINASKTKIVVFNKRKIANKPVFTLNGEILNVVDEFTYLGIIFTHNGSFCKNRIKLLEQGRKAMYSMLKKCRSLGLPIDLQLKMFDTMVTPILLYGCEIWGFENNNAIESLFLQFYKIILGVKKSTPNCILYGELGRFPVDIFIKSRMIGLWKRIICNKQDKISAMLYKLLYTMHERDFFHFKWICHIENIFNESGYSDYWLSQNVPKSVNISKIVKQRLCDQFKQTWSTTVFNSPKCLNYRIFKCNHTTVEQYLLQLPNDLRNALCNFRCLNHKLPIEKGRFWGVERDDRICDICNSYSLGDEYHYLFQCSFFNNERRKLLPHIHITNPNTLKFHDLLNSEDYDVIFKLAKFCKIILSVVK